MIASVHFKRHFPCAGLFPLSPSLWELSFLYTFLGPHIHQGCPSGTSFSAHSARRSIKACPATVGVRDFVQVSAATSTRKRTRESELISAREMFLMNTDVSVRHHLGRPWPRRTSQITKMSRMEVLNGRLGCNSHTSDWDFTIMQGTGCAPALMHSVSTCACAQNTAAVQNSGHQRSKCRFAPVLESLNLAKVAFRPHTFMVHIYAEVRLSSAMLYQLL